MITVSTGLCYITTARNLYTVTPLWQANDCWVVLDRQAQLVHMAQLTVPYEIAGAGFQNLGLKQLQFGFPRVTGAQQLESLRETTAVTAD
jgi:hypothetical protein